MSKGWARLLGVIITFIAVSIWCIVQDRAAMRAQEGPNHWVIYKDSDTRIIKIQDGPCSIYMSEPSTNSVQASPVQLSAGPGCRR